MTYYFSREDIKEEKLTQLSLLQFPANVSSLFPDLGNAEFIYTSFTRKVKGFQPFPVDFRNPDNYNQPLESLAKLKLLNITCFVYCKFSQ